MPTTTTPAPEWCCYSCVLLASGGASTVSLNCKLCGPPGCPDKLGCHYGKVFMEVDFSNPTCWGIAVPCEFWHATPGTGKTCYVLMSDTCYD